MGGSTDDEHLSNLEAVFQQFQTVRAEGQTPQVCVHGLFSDILRSTLLR